jgi:hypothetical protein
MCQVEFVSAALMDLEYASVSKLTRSQSVSISKSARSSSTCGSLNWKLGVMLQVNRQLAVMTA